MTETISTQTSETLASASLSYTKQLVEIPSVSGNEQGCFTYVHDWMQAQKLEGIVQTDGYVAGYKKGHDSSQALILTGHVDTVSAGDLAAWHTDPWQLTPIDDKTYGLGVTDMKAGIATQMAAIESTQTPSVDTWLVVVANEEVDGSGSEAFCSYFDATYEYESASAIIAEPTNLDHIAVGNRGNAFVKLEFEGQAGHASQQPNYVKSALYSAAQFLSVIDVLASDAVKKYADPVLGIPTIVPTGMKAGDFTSPNKTADSASVMLDIRTTPAFNAELADWLDILANEHHFIWQEHAKPVPPCVCEPTAPIIAQLKAAAGDMPTKVKEGATDQVFFQQIGIDTIVYGPGQFEQAHVQNESIITSKIAQAAIVYTKILN